MLYFCGKTTFFKYFYTCYTGQGSDLSHDCPKMALKISVHRVSKKKLILFFGLTLRILFFGGLFQHEY